MPSDEQIKITTQMYMLFKSAQRSVLTKIPISINKPPIVGVPLFLTM